MHTTQRYIETVRPLVAIALPGSLSLHSPLVIVLAPPTLPDPSHFPLLLWKDRVSDFLLLHTLLNVCTGCVFVHCCLAACASLIERFGVSCTPSCGSSQHL